MIAPLSKKVDLGKNPACKQVKLQKWWQKEHLRDPGLSPNELLANHLVGRVTIFIKREKILTQKGKEPVKSNLDLSCVQDSDLVNPGRVKRNAVSKECLLPSRCSTLEMFPLKPSEYCSVVVTDQRQGIENTKSQSKEVLSNFPPLINCQNRAMAESSWARKAIGVMWHECPVTWECDQSGPLLFCSDRFRNWNFLRQDRRKLLLNDTDVSSPCFETLSERMRIKDHIFMILNHLISFTCGDWREGVTCEQETSKQLPPRSIFMAINGLSIPLQSTEPIAQNSEETCGQAWFDIQPFNGLRFKLN